MEVIAKKEGYGYILKWLIKLGDLILINLYFIVLYLFFDKMLWGDAILTRSIIGEAFLMINLSYFITANIVEDDISLNIIFFDKLIEKTFSFITLYTLILVVGFSLFRIIDLPWSTWFAIYATLCLLYMLWHVLLRTILKLYRKRGYNYKLAIIVGGGLNGVNVYNELNSSVYGYKVLGFFDDNPYSNSVLNNYLGKTSEIEEYCQTHRVDEIYCTLPGSQEAKILNILNMSEKKMIRFFLVPEFYKYIKRRMILRSLQTIPIVAIRKEPLQSSVSRFAKRTFDILFSSTVLLTIFPIVYIVFGSIIKLTSKGPIFFKQERTGLGGKVFGCYKFRSMRLNKEANTKAAVKEDPRITAIGSFMRKTSIDELPQFINVFIGNMSIVGPRPHMIQQTELYTKLIDQFMIRHIVKPGITGWAQVSGFRGETNTIDKMEGRVRRDVWYIENWSFFLDIKIIFVTILNIFRGEEEAF